MARFGFMHQLPSYPRPIPFTIGVWLSVPTKVSGKTSRNFALRLLLIILKVYLVARLPIPGEVLCEKLSKEFCAHFQKNGKAFFIALVFHIYISLVGIFRSKVVYLYRVIYQLKSTGKIKRIDSLPGFFHLSCNLCARAAYPPPQETPSKNPAIKNTQPA